MSRAAEWCEHDDEILHPIVDDKRQNIHLKRAGLADKEAVRAWAKGSKATVSGVTAEGTVNVMITGPAFPWRAEFSHGWVSAEPAETVYEAGASHSFALRKTA